MTESVRFIAIHILVPLLGILLYLMICRKMRIEKVQSPPVLELFFVFFTFGGVIIVLLTQFFWYWSGMASLGVFYLIFIAPLVLFFVDRNNKTKTSKYHKWTSRAIKYYAYFVVVLIALFLMLKMFGSWH